MAMKGKMEEAYKIENFIKIYFYKTNRRSWIKWNKGDSVISQQSFQFKKEKIPFLRFSGCSPPPYSPFQPFPIHSLSYLCIWYDGEYIVSSRASSTSYAVSATVIGWNGRKIFLKKLPKYERTNGNVWMEEGKEENWCWKLNGRKI